MYYFDPIYGMVPTPAYVAIQIPVCAKPPFHPTTKELKTNIQKAVDALVWLQTCKKKQTNDTEKMITRRAPKKFPRPQETLENIIKRWKQEKKIRRKFWRVTKVKPNEWLAVKMMVNLILAQNPNYRCLPAVGTRWAFVLEGLVTVANRYRMSDRKLRNLTKIALGYRRSHTEDTIDKPKDIYRFFGFDEAIGKKLLFSAVKERFEK